MPGIHSGPRPPDERPNVCASARHRFARPSAATIVDGNVCAGSAGPARRPVAFTFADAPMPKPCDAGGGAETQTSRSPIRPAPHDHLFPPTRQIRGAGGVMLHPTLPTYLRIEMLQSNQTRGPQYSRSPDRQPMIHDPCPKIRCPWPESPGRNPHSMHTAPRCPQSQAAPIARAYP